MRLACSTRPFSADRLERALSKIAWAGYPAVEVDASISTGSTGELPDEGFLRTRLRAEELELAAIAVGEVPLAGVSTGSVEALGGLGRAAALARALDGPLIVASAPQQGEIAELAAALRLLDRALGEMVVDLCVVHAPETLLAVPEDLRALWSAGVPARVGLALDPARAALSGWDAALLDQLPAPPRHIYLTDLRNGRPVPPGEGDLDLAAFGKALRRSGYSGSVTTLLENADPWAVEPLAREAAELAAGWFGADIR